MQLFAKFWFAPGYLFLNHLVVMHTAVLLRGDHALWTKTSSRGNHSSARSVFHQLGLQVKSEAAILFSSVDSLHQKDDAQVLFSSVDSLYDSGTKGKNAVSTTLQMPSSKGSSIPAPALAQAITADEMNASRIVPHVQVPAASEENIDCCSVQAIQNHDESVKQSLPVTSGSLKNHDRSVKNLTGITASKGNIHSFSAYSSAASESVNTQGISSELSHQLHGNSRLNQLKEVDPAAFFNQEFSSKFENDEKQRLLHTIKSTAASAIGDCDFVSQTHQNGNCNLMLALDKSSRSIVRAESLSCAVGSLISELYAEREQVVLAAKENQEAVGLVQEINVKLHHVQNHAENLHVEMVRNYVLLDFPDLVEKKMKSEILLAFDLLPP
jgi:hypothetical protein